jgi:hypothetical protein
VYSRGRSYRDGSDDESANRSQEELSVDITKYDKITRDLSTHLY